MNSNQEPVQNEKKTRKSVFIESVFLSLAVAFLFLAAVFLKIRYFSGSYTNIDVIGGAFFVFFLSWIIFLILLPRVRDMKKT
ncbi:hypothetical protein [Methanolapillus millepedarum]|uniref:Uncharacterized protein n=1 Tax=Methanolapillus millepedarum TaxID=3028296 RepID=A0AA96VCE1_9EURY|nr:hypothetical protein MsAc7_11430 [Methanosarcinaceae archaeon Ac7]